MLRRALAVTVLAIVLPGAFVSTFAESGELSLEPTVAAAETALAAAAPGTQAQAAEVAAAAPEPQVCPAGMVLVDGDFCTEVEHECSHWLDDPKLPYARCGEYSNARCTGQRTAMRFCIDQYEYTAPGETLPQNFASYQIASRTCQKLGKRVCGENEWTFACEGEEMRPYAYGFSRKPVCNYDKSDLYEMNKKKQVLKDLRAPNGAHPECKSPFGVYDMAGNMDEPTRIEHPVQPGFHNALKGGWWMAARNRCRPSTTAHDDYYKDIQIGVRCCADAPESAGEPSG